MVTVTKYVWDPVFDCVTHELDENNNVKAVYNNEPQQYGGLLSQRRGNTSHYHHHDALGSTRFLTDSSGNVTDTYLHDAWGNSVASTGTTINPFKWVGKYGYYTDNSTAQVYVRARMYQPTVAKWCSADPLNTFFRSNFAYCENTPVSIIDPAGRFGVGPVFGSFSAAGVTTGETMIAADERRAYTDQPECVATCDRAGKNRFLNRGGGGVICDCDVNRCPACTKCPCVFEFPGLDEGHIDCDLTRKCTLMHERGHIDSATANCDPLRPSHDGLSRLGSQFDDPIAEQGRIRDECRLRLAEIQCLTRGIAISGTTELCKHTAQKSIALQQKWLKDHYEDCNTILNWEGPVP